MIRSAPSTLGKSTSSIVFDCHHRPAQHSIDFAVNNSWKAYIFFKLINSNDDTEAEGQ